MGPYAQKKPHVAVIGAGIAGLVAAYELTNKGFDVVVYEMEERLGGRMHSALSQGFIFDGGANFFLDRYFLIRSYVHELKLPWSYSLHGSIHRIWKGGKVYAVDLSGPLSVLRFKLLSFKARLAFLALLIRVRSARESIDFFYLSPSTKSAETSDAESYLCTAVHPEVAHYIADAFCGMIQFHRLGEMSVQATMSLLKIFVSGGFRIWHTQGGMAALPQKLAERLQVRYGMSVRSLDHTNGAMRIRTDSGEESADIIILATTGSVARELMPTHSKNSAALFAALRYAATIVIAFRVPADLFVDGMHMTYVPYVENNLIAGYTNEMRKEKMEGDEGLLNVILHEEGALHCFAMTDAAIASLVHAELQKLCPEMRGKEAAVCFQSLVRWKEAMPVYSSELISTVRDFEERGQGENNIFLVGDYMNGPWIEGAARSGKRVAELIEQRFLEA